jgi:hypothetical protein
MTPRAFLETDLVLERFLCGADVKEGGGEGDGSVLTSLSKSAGTGVICSDDRSGQL